MISDAMKRLAKAVGLKPASEPPPAPKPTRTAVLRPKDAGLSVRRLAEWEALMDRALDGPSLDRGRKEADAVWLTLKREQPWTFVGWLGPDAKAVVDDSGRIVDTAQPGDLHEAESRLGGWR